MYLAPYTGGKPELLLKPSFIQRKIEYVGYQLYQRYQEEKCAKI